MELVLVRYGLVILAINFIAFTAAQDHGPGGIFSSLREWVLSEDFPEWVNDGIQCPICWGFWLSFLLVALFIPSLTLSEYFLHVLAFSGLNGLIERKWKG